MISTVMHSQVEGPVIQDISATELTYKPSEMQKIENSNELPENRNLDIEEKIFELSIFSLMKKLSDILNFIIELYAKGVQFVLKLQFIPIDNNESDKKEALEENNGKDGSNNEPSIDITTSVSDASPTLSSSTMEISSSQNSSSSSGSIYTSSGGGYSSYVERNSSGNRMSITEENLLETHRKSVEYFDYLLKNPEVLFVKEADLGGDRIDDISPIEENEKKLSEVLEKISKMENFKVICSKLTQGTPFEKIKFLVKMNSGLDENAKDEEVDLFSNLFVLIYENEGAFMPEQFEEISNLLLREPSKLFENDHPQEKMAEAENEDDRHQIISDG